MEQFVCQTRHPGALLMWFFSLDKTGSGCNAISILKSQIATWSQALHKNSRSLSRQWSHGLLTSYTGGQLASMRSLDRVWRVRTASSLRLSLVIWRLTQLRNLLNLQRVEQKKLITNDYSSVLCNCCFSAQHLTMIMISERWCWRILNSTWASVLGFGWSASRMLHFQARSRKRISKVSSCHSAEAAEAAGAATAVDFRHHRCYIR
jgi:hypothetical protein